MQNKTNISYASNSLIDNLPKHLKQFIKPQVYDDYSPIDQAVWRFVMRQNIVVLPKIAHPSYLKGLQLTGIEVDRIPSMYGMNRILKKIGWAAVAVDGFIPPNAFMEFQAYKVLVIASDIRQLENIAYTPSPDIIHEAAGHAPMIANPDYAEYLRRLGAIGAKAIMSSYDIELYEAVRKLSILKEAKGVPEKDIQQANEKVEYLQNLDVPTSEMLQIRNLQWWSVEYGLIGDINNPTIYGAGLLSSIGESISCLKDNVKKIPFAIEASHKSFDITKPQPQLFVTPDFSTLMEVLESFANSLSLRKGGTHGLKKLIASKMVGTIELNTGLQISGKFTTVLTDEDQQVIFFKTEGPTALAYREKEIIGHGIQKHTNGFSSPLGKLKNINLAIEDMGPNDLKAYNFYDGKWLAFEFESGIKVEGLNITGFRNIQGKLMLIQLENCTVHYQNKILYKPEYGPFDMVVGSSIISAYAGAADPDSFPNLYNVSKVHTIRPKKTPKQLELESYYQSVRSFRENASKDLAYLVSVFEQVANNHPDEWLLLLEIYELSLNTDLEKKLEDYLTRLAQKYKKYHHLITEGMTIAHKLNHSTSSSKPA